MHHPSNHHHYFAKAVNFCAQIGALTPIGVDTKMYKISGAQYEIGRYRTSHTRSRGLELGSMTDTEGGGIA